MYARGPDAPGQTGGQDNMTSILKRYIAFAAAAVIFFSLLCALCPIDALAVPKARARAQKQTRQVEQQEGEQAREEIAQPVAAEQEAAAPADKAGQAPAAAGTAGTGNNAFNLDGNFQNEQSEPESYGWLIFKTIFVIGLLVGGFYYFFRFVTRKVGIQMLGRDVVQVLSVVPIGQNKYLQVVDLAGRVLVLGVTDSNINFITEIQEKDEIDRIRLMSTRPVAHEAAPFQEFLAKQLGKIIGKKDAGAVVEAHEPRPFGDTDRLDYLKRQRERLRKINGSDNEA